jgi:hypothetical protein
MSATTNEAPPQTAEVGAGWWGDVARGWGAGWCTTAGWSWRCAMASRVVTVNDVLDGHVTLDLECLDRIYLNGYVPAVLMYSSRRPVTEPPDSSRSAW